MTDRDKSILEEPEKMCDYCCNFDKEHIGVRSDTELCKLTMTLAYAEDYGGNCMFYNVPKEQIIVPPCKVGDMVYVINEWEVEKTTVFSMKIESQDSRWVTFLKAKVADHGIKFKDGYGSMFKTFVFGKTAFLTKSQAEVALKNEQEKL